MSATIKTHLKREEINWNAYILKGGQKDVIPEKKEVMPNREN